MAKNKTFSNIRDVASLANVSISTVSRVINHPELASEDTIKKVNDAIEKCSYIPNIMTTRLISGKTNTIALFVLDISNRFYTSLIKELLDLTYNHGYNLFICETGNSAEKTAKYLKYVKSLRVDGIIYTCGPSLDFFSSDIPFQIPLVLNDHEQSGDIKAFSVHSNDDMISRTLVNYLHNLNHKRIAFVGGPKEFSSVKKRFEAYKKYMRINGLKIKDDYCFFGTFDESTGMKAFEHFYSLSEPPTGIICASDQLATGFLSRALSLGVRIPDDFSLCSTDACNEYSFTKITSTKQDIPAIAKAIFDFFINKGKYKLPCEKIIDVKFVEGQTCKRID